MEFRIEAKTEWRVSADDENEARRELDEFLTEVEIPGEVSAITWSYDAVREENDG